MIDIKRITEEAKSVSVTEEYPTILPYIIYRDVLEESLNKMVTQISRTAYMKKIEVAVMESTQIISNIDEDDYITHSVNEFYKESVRILIETAIAYTGLESINDHFINVLCTLIKESSLKV